MCGAAGSPRTGLRRVGRGGQDPSELASRCAAATGLSCRASRCMSGSASVPAAQLPTAASRCATLQALHTPVHQMWGGAARTPARASTVVDNTCPQKGNFFLVALTATLLPLRPVGPDGLPIMIGASVRQEPGIRGHPPGSWRKPRVPSHCYDDAAQFREAVFSGASPVRVR